MAKHRECWVKASQIKAAFDADNKRVPERFVAVVSDFVRELVALSVQTGAAPEAAAKAVPVRPPLTGAAVQAAIAKRVAGERVPDLLAEAKTISSLSIGQQGCTGTVEDDVPGAAPIYFLNAQGGGWHKAGQEVIRD